MIKIQNLTKACGNSILIDDLSFEFEKGILGIVTSSKQEKTALLNILSANDTSFSGDVLYGTLNIQKDSKALKRKIGYLIDGAPLYEDMTVREFLDFIGQAKKISPEKLYNQISDVLELIEFGNKKDILIANLTRRERKLLSIAQALIGNPTVIILDDPFSGLGNEFLQIAKTIIKMLSDIKPVFLFGISNDQLLKLCNSALIISDGSASFHNDLEALKEIYGIADEPENETGATTDEEMKEEEEEI